MKRNGTDGVVKTGANVIANLNQWDFTDSVNKVTGRAFGESVETAAAGARTITGNLKGFLDPDDTDGQNALVAGATLPLELYPEGSTTGDVFYDVTEALIETVTITAQTDQYVAFDASFHANTVPTLETAP